MMNTQPINFKNTNRPKKDTATQVVKYSVAGLAGAGVGYGISSSIKRLPITESSTRSESTKYGNYLYKYHGQAVGSRVLVQHKYLKPNKPPKGMFALIGMVVGLCAMKIYDYFSKNKA